MRILYLDCFSGAAGDMLLGALIDAGVPLDGVRRALGSLAISPDTIWTERVTRAGVSATKFCVAGEEPPLDRADDHEGHGHDDDHGHQHSHEHGHGHHGRAGHDAGASDSGASEKMFHAHRSLAEIHRLVDGSALSADGKTRAHALFDRLGEAEAAIHGTTLDAVHLHEVGALDSIIDVVGSVFALEFLAVDRVVSSPLNVGGGTIRSAHGRYPVPAPATLRLLGDAPIYGGPQQVELVTPTGALLVTDYASAYGPVPAMRVRQVGYGAGTRDLPDTPNVLRVLVGESDAPTVQTVVVVEAEIDDMNPQIFGVLMDRLLAQGALDVFFTPIQMKKNRPGTLLSVVAPPGLRDALMTTIFRETTTIGVRYRETMRECLERETVTVQTPLGVIRVKVARRDGAVWNVAPEFDDCVRVATEHDRPVKEIQALALRAFYDR